MKSKNVTAFVLAGGASRRMGRDKALLELGGVPMIVRTMQILEPLVSTAGAVAPRGKYASLGLRMVEDRWPGAGPLGGIITVLCASSAEWNLIVACDLPFLTAGWIEWLVSRALNSAAQAIVPESRRGIEPLAAIYHRNCGPPFAAAFDRGIRSVREALCEVPFERISREEWCGVEPSDVLRNINTPHDFAEAQGESSRGLMLASKV